jgi:hypothetical protein
MGQCFALADAWGRVLKASAGASIDFDDGIVTESALFRLVKQTDDESCYLLSPHGGCLFLRYFKGISTFALTELHEEAQSFQIKRSSAEQDGHGCCITFMLAGGPEAVQSAGQQAPQHLCSRLEGSVSTSTQPFAFDVLVDPILGTVTALWATNRAGRGDASSVCIWAGPSTAHAGLTADSGWLSPNLVTFFDAGKVTGRVRTLGIWEVFSLKLVDAGAGTVALKTPHGRWLCVNPDCGRLTADKKEIGGWEQVKLEQVDPKTVNIVSYAHFGGKAALLCVERCSGGVGTSDRALFKLAANINRDITSFTLIDAQEARRRYNQSIPSTASGVE